MKKRGQSAAFMAKIRLLRGKNKSKTHHIKKHKRKTHKGSKLKNYLERIYWFWLILKFII